jgi:hypothetical protein
MLTPRFDASLTEAPSQSSIQQALAENVAGVDLEPSALSEQEIINEIAREMDRRATNLGYGLGRALRPLVKWVKRGMQQAVAGLKRMTYYGIALREEECKDMHAEKHMCCDGIDEILEYTLKKSDLREKDKWMLEAGVPDPRQLYERAIQTQDRGLVRQLAKHGILYDQFIVQAQDQVHIALLHKQLWKVEGFAVFRKEFSQLLTNPKFTRIIEMAVAAQRDDVISRAEHILQEKQDKPILIVLKSPEHFNDSFNIQIAISTLSNRLNISKVYISENDHGKILFYTKPKDLQLAISDVIENILAEESSLNSVAIMPSHLFQKAETNEQLNDRFHVVSFDINHTINFSTISDLEAYTQRAPNAAEISMPELPFLTQMDAYDNMLHNVLLKILGFDDYYDAPAVPGLYLTENDYAEIIENVTSSKPETDGVCFENQDFLSHYDESKWYHILGPITQFKNAPRELAKLIQTLSFLLQENTFPKNSIELSIVANISKSIVSFCTLLTGWSVFMSLANTIILLPNIIAQLPENLRQNLAVLKQVLAELEQCLTNLKEQYLEKVKGWQRQANPLFVAVANEDIEAVIRLLAENKTDINQQNIDGDTVMHYALAKENRAIIEALLAQQTVDLFKENHQKVTPLLLAVAIGNKTILDMMESYLSEDKVIALQLVTTKNKIAKMEEQLAKEDVDIDGARQNDRANLYFNRVVEPHFKSQFESYDETDEKRIVKIENEIRGLILEDIKKNYPISDDFRKFIDDNWSNLIQGENSALAASVPYFENEMASPYSAWRAYNPHAPSSGYFDNLLRPRNDQYGHSLVIRKKVAYYYLAVVDPAYPENKENRVQNFITKLGEMRNGHGLDKHMCYRGTTTAVSLMGRFHPVAELPPTEMSLIKKFLKRWAVDKFKDALAKCENDDMKKQLLEGLVFLTSENAEDFLRKSELQISELQIALRKMFSASLCDEPQYLKEQCEIDLKSELSIENTVYFEQFKKDPAYHFSQKFYDVYQAETGTSVATLEQIEEARNKFENRSSSVIYTILFELCIRHNPSLTKGQLNDVVFYLSERTDNIGARRITEEGVKQIFTTVSQMMGLNEFDGKVAQAAIEKLRALDWIKIENPYEIQIASIQSQLRHCKNDKLKAGLEKRLFNLQKQADAIMPMVIDSAPAQSGTKRHRDEDPSAEQEQKRIRHS